VFVCLFVLFLLNWFNIENIKEASSVRNVPLGLNNTHSTVLFYDSKAGEPYNVICRFVNTRIIVQ